MSSDPDADLLNRWNGMPKIALALGALSVVAYGVFGTEIHVIAVSFLVAMAGFIAVELHRTEPEVVRDECPDAGSGEQATEAVGRHDLVETFVETLWKALVVITVVSWLVYGGWVLITA